MSEKNGVLNFILSKNHILPSPIANKVGIPTLRTILSNFLINLRRFKNCRAENIHEKELIDKGITVIPNFLPEDDFQKLKKEFNEVISEKEVRQTDYGSTKSISKIITKEKYASFEAIQNLANNKELIRLISVGEGRKVFKEIDTLVFEKTTFGDPKHDTDVNLRFHADIHFHSHKVLYYMDDVTSDMGPFEYCVGSHKNNIKRLWFEFKRGQLKDAHDNTWRIDNHYEKKYFKKFYEKLMKNKYEVTGKANTLIIANVHGFHRRGEASEGPSRSLIRIPFRYNPFGNQKKISYDSYSGNFF